MKIVDWLRIVLMGMLLCAPAMLVGCYGTEETITASKTQQIIQKPDRTDGMYLLEVCLDGIEYYVLNGSLAPKYTSDGIVAKCERGVKRD